jgi:hypothetical protein
MQLKLDPENRLAWSWVGLCLTLAIHVTDEALTGFLEFYNPTVSAIREQIPFLPIPTFQFEVWIAGLGLGILILLGCSVFAFRRAGWMIPVAIILSGLMLLNGALHICGSLYFGQMIPGVYSSPLLMAAAGFLLYAASKAKKTWSQNRRCHPTVDR